MGILYFSVMNCQFLQNSCDAHLKYICIEAVLVANSSINGVLEPLESQMYLWSFKQMENIQEPQTVITMIYSTLSIISSNSGLIS